MHRGTQAYFQTQAATTDQGEVVILLFDGAIKFLHRAKERITAKDYTEKGNLISKALDIINELDSTLNQEKGGDLAQNLHQLYFICSSKLLKANLKLDTVLIDEVLLVLQGLRDAFTQIVKTPEAMAAAQEVALTKAAGAASHRSRSKALASTHSPEAGRRIASMYASYPESGATGTSPTADVENASGTATKFTLQTKKQVIETKDETFLSFAHPTTDTGPIGSGISSKKTASIYQQTIAKNNK